MFYNYNFEIASVVLTAAVMVMYLFRRAYRTRSNAIFFAMLVLNLVASLSNILTTYTISFPAEFPEWIDWASNIIFLTAHNITAVTFFSYVCILVKGDHSLRFESLLWRTLGTVIVLLMITTPLTHWIFYLDEHLVYCHGPLFPLLYIISVFLLIYSVCIMLKYRSKISSYQAAAMIFYIAIVLGAIVLHVVFSNVLTEDFAAILALILVYLSLENPADYMYKDTFCYNDRALDRAVGDYISSGVPFSVVGFTFSDAKEFARNVDVEVIDDVTKRVIDMLHGLFSNRRVFCLDKLTFAVISSPQILNRLKQSKGCSDDLTCMSTTAADAIKQKIIDSGTNAMPFFHIVNYPDFIENVDDFNNAMRFGLSNVHITDSRHVTVATRSSLSVRERKIAVLTALRKALENRTLTLNFQPIRQVATGKYISAEVLCRLIDDEMGFIPPDEFITLAEQNGLAPAISDYVVEESCRFFKENDLASLGIEYLEINLSALDFVRDNLGEKLMGFLNEYDLRPDQINFEITETAAAGTSVNVFTATMEQMAKAGMRFSVDDFGSGYASISYLIKVPAEIVKIDKGILWAAMEDESAFTVLATTLALVNQLGKHSLCEGVENEKMAIILEEMGCAYFQGYLYSKPLTGPEFIEFLRTNN